MNVLIPGGAGSIGSELVKRLVQQGDRVRVLDISEENLWRLKMEVPEVEIQLGDVRDSVEINDADAVVYCAACKHVDLCEGAESLAFGVNATAATHWATAAANAHAPFIYLSTDKAIEPTGVMGRSKKAGEEAVLSSGGRVVRFGNVLGTRGSLVPAIVRYRALKRPIPVTDPGMTRFFMAVREAVDLVLDAMQDDAAGILEPVTLRSASIGDFIETCRDVLAPGHPVEIIGPRPGERTHERLTSGSSNDPRFLMDRHDIMALLERSGVITPEMLACAA